MTTQISINIVCRAPALDDMSEDKDRAEAAALRVLGDVSPEAAYAEYLRQFTLMDNDPDGPIDIHSAMTGLAALWVAAGKAADIALTEGWQNPAGAYCEISA